MCVLPHAIANPLWGDEFRTWRDSENVLIAGVYRPVDGPRYLTVIQPAVWLGLACFNRELMVQSDRTFNVPFAADSHFMVERASRPFVCPVL